MGQLLRLGSSGTLVKQLQQELKAAGFDPQGVDGIFGVNTLAAVVAYQKAHGLKVDGIAGTQTNHALDTDGFTPPNAHGPTRVGGARLFGADTAHWQSDDTFHRTIAGAKWSAIGASDGHTFTDPVFKQRWAELGQRIKDGQMKLRIAYHYLEPGDGKGQAKHFLDVLGIHGPLKPGTRLALDWEGKALSSPQTLRDAARYIHQVTGIWPMVYCSESNVPTARRMVPAAPLWMAKWTGGLGVHDVPFVQYSDGPGYDHDFFNGNLKQLEKFAGWP